MSSLESQNQRQKIALRLSGERAWEMDRYCLMVTVSVENDLERGSGDGYATM